MHPNTSTTTCDYREVAYSGLPLNTQVRTSKCMLYTDAMCIVERSCVVKQPHNKPFIALSFWQAWEFNKRTKLASNFGSQLTNTQSTDLCLCLTADWLTDLNRTVWLMTELSETAAVFISVRPCNLLPFFGADWCSGVTSWPVGRAIRLFSY